MKASLGAKTISEQKRDSNGKQVSDQKPDTIGICESEPTKNSHRQPDSDQTQMRNENQIRTKDKVASKTILEQKPDKRHRKFFDQRQNRTKDKFGPQKNRDRKPDSGRA